MKIIPLTPTSDLTEIMLFAQEIRLNPQLNNAAKKKILKNIGYLLYIKEHLAVFYTDLTKDTNFSPLFSDVGVDRASPLRISINRTYQFNTQEYPNKKAGMERLAALVGECENAITLAREKNGLLEFALALGHNTRFDSFENLAVIARTYNQTPRNNTVLSIPLEACVQPDIAQRIAQLKVLTENTFVRSTSRALCYGFTQYELAKKLTDWLNSLGLGSLFGAQLMQGAQRWEVLVLHTELKTFFDAGFLVNFNESAQAQEALEQHFLELQYKINTHEKLPTVAACFAYFHPNTINRLLNTSRDVVTEGNTEKHPFFLLCAQTEGNTENYPLFLLCAQYGTPAQFRLIIEKAAPTVLHNIMLTRHQGIPLLHYLPHYQSFDAFLALFEKGVFQGDTPETLQAKYDALRMTEIVPIPESEVLKNYHVIMQSTHKHSIFPQIDALPIEQLIQMIEETSGLGENALFMYYVTHANQHQLKLLLEKIPTWLLDHLSSQPDFPQALLHAAMLGVATFEIVIQRLSPEIATQINSTYLGQAAQENTDNTRLQCAIFAALFPQADIKFLNRFAANHNINVYTIIMDFSDNMIDVLLSGSACNTIYSQAHPSYLKLLSDGPYFNGSHFVDIFLRTSSACYAVIAQQIGNSFLFDFLLEPSKHSDPTQRMLTHFIESTPAALLDEMLFNAQRTTLSSLVPRLRSEVLKLLIDKIAVRCIIRALTENLQKLGCMPLLHHVAIKHRSETFLALLHKLMSDPENGHLLFVRAVAITITNMGFVFLPNIVGILFAKQSPLAINTFLSYMQRNELLLSRLIASNRDKFSQQYLLCIADDSFLAVPESILRVIFCAEFPSAYRILVDYCKERNLAGKRLPQTVLNILNDSSEADPDSYLDFSTMYPEDDAMQGDAATQGETHSPELELIRTKAASNELLFKIIKPEHWADFIHSLADNTFRPPLRNVWRVWSCRWAMRISCDTG